uniref:Uncharacterized protein n=2 Tax=Emiliania huxleyi TaxID=2903 RepID=A0A7S3SIY2_EMIHU
MSLSGGSRQKVWWPRSQESHSRMSSSRSPVPQRTQLYVASASASSARSSSSVGSGLRCTSGSTARTWNVSGRYSSKVASASGYLSATFLLLPLGYPSAGLPLGGCLSALPLGCISATVRLPRTAAVRGCLSAAEPRLPLRYLLSLTSITPAASFLETVATLLLQSGHEDSVSSTHRQMHAKQKVCWQQSSAPRSPKLVSSRMVAAMQMEQKSSSALPHGGAERPPGAPPAPLAPPPLRRFSDAVRGRPAEPREPTPLAVAWPPTEPEQAPDPDPSTKPVGRGVAG